MDYQQHGGRGCYNCESLSGVCSSGEFRAASSRLLPLAKTIYCLTARERVGSSHIQDRQIQVSENFICMLSCEKSSTFLLYNVVTNFVHSQRW